MSIIYALTLTLTPLLPFFFSFKLVYLDTSMVASTIGSERVRTFSGNCFKNAMRMVEKINLRLGFSRNVNDKKLKWRVKRGVIGFLPPPGGPIAHTNCASDCVK
jgi:hypothetical protein